MIQGKQFADITWLFLAIPFTSKPNAARNIDSFRRARKTLIVCLHFSKSRLTPGAVA